MDYLGFPTTLFPLVVKNLTLISQVVCLMQIQYSSLMDKKRDDIMPQAVGSFNKYIQSADATVFKTGYYFNRAVSAIFFLAMILSLFKMKSIAFLGHNIYLTCFPCHISFHHFHAASRYVFAGNFLSQIPYFLGS